MIVEQLEVGVFAENCYIVGCRKTYQGVVIDPGDEIERILGVVDSKKFDIKYILLTHAHLDHVKELKHIKKELNVPVYMHKADQFLIDNLPAQAAAFGLTTSGIPGIDAYIDEKDTINFGGIHFDILHTPGHSPGSVSFVTDGVVFVGDVLFSGSIGRTDLPGGDYNTLITSIKEKLIPLGDEMMVYSGHGPPTTIGQERETNPFLI